MENCENEFTENKEQTELKSMLEKADNAVVVAVGTTAATGAIPFPFADAPLLIGQQVALMATLSGIFEIDVKKDGLKALAATALGVSGAAVFGKTIATNLLKFIPGAGSVLGGAISAGTAGMVTLAMGKAYIEVCKAVKTGKLSENDITSSIGSALFKDYFKAEIKNREQEEKDKIEILPK